MKTCIALMATLIIVAPSVETLACGDSLYRVGKGVAYRTYAAPLPGNLLVYVESEHDRQMAAELANSGHQVHLVTDAAEFAAAIGKNTYDIVIAPFSERIVVESAVQRAGSSIATYVPVTTNKIEKQQAKHSYGNALTAGDDIKRYLKTIHVELKKKA